MTVLLLLIIEFHSVYANCLQYTHTHTCTPTPTHTTTTHRYVTAINDTHTTHTHTMIYGGILYNIQFNVYNLEWNMNIYFMYDFYFGRLIYIMLFIKYMLFVFLRAR